MKKLQAIRLIASAILLSSLVGCEIVTENQPPPVLTSADNIVINELFILPPPSQNTYQWIELYNPTNRDIDITKWTLGFRTQRTTYALNRRLQSVTDVFYFDSSLTYHDVGLYSILQVDTTYILGTSYGTNAGDTVRAHSDLFVFSRSIAAHSFLTYVNNENRMLTYTDWGPGGGDKIIGQSWQEYEHDFWVATIDTGGTTYVQSDSSIFTTTVFSFQPAEQLVLKDSSGNTVDVMRYGGSAFQYPNPDPYPDNRALGAIVPYQSFARYAGAYKTGAYSNSASDFYVTGVQVALTRPIPHWLSQAHKQ